MTYSLDSLSGYNPMTDPYFMAALNSPNANSGSATQSATPTFQAAQDNTYVAPYGQPVTADALLSSQPKKKGNGGLIIGGGLAIGAGVLALMGHNNKKKGAENIWQGIKMIFSKEVKEAAGKTASGKTRPEVKFSVTKNSSGEYVYTIPGKNHSLVKKTSTANRKPGVYAHTRTKLSVADLQRYGIDSSTPKLGTEGTKLSSVEITVSGKEKILWKGDKYYKKDTKTGKYEECDFAQDKIDALNTAINDFANGKPVTTKWGAAPIRFGNCRYFHTTNNAIKLIEQPSKGEAKIINCTTNNHLQGDTVGAYLHDNSSAKEVVEAITNKKSPDGMNISCKYQLARKNYYKDNKGKIHDTNVIIKDGKIAGIEIKEIGKSGKTVTNTYGKDSDKYKAFMTQQEKYIEKELSEDKIAKFKFGDSSISDLVYTAV